MDPVNIPAKVEVRIALRVPEIIENKNLGSPWIRPRSLFSNFLRACVRMDPVNIPAKSEVPSFSRP